MVFRRKKETTAVQIARVAGKLAGKAVRTGGKVAVTAVAATRATRTMVANVGDAVSQARNAAKRSAARRRRRKALQSAGRTLKTAGKAAAVVGLAAAVSEIARRRR